VKIVIGNVVYCHKPPQIALFRLTFAWNDPYLSVTDDRKITRGKNGLESFYGACSPEEKMD